MAWWDHEELKSLPDRSDRYKVAFPEHYSAEEVREAAERLGISGVIITNQSHKANQSDMLEQGIHDALANATLRINKETDMSENRATSGRPSETETSDTVEKTIAETLNRLITDRQFAEDEERYWRKRREDAELTIDALQAAQNKFNVKYEDVKDTVSVTDQRRF
jgi:hypothetical protein